MDGKGSQASGADAAAGGLLRGSFENEGPKRRRVSGKQEGNVEAMVAKSIKDNFKGFGPAEIDGTTIGNMTLRERIRQDKVLNNESPGSIIMGRRYYDDLRALYAAGDSPDKLLKACIKDPNASIAPALFQAMVKAKNHPMNRQPMIEYMSISPEPKREEVIGIYRLCLSVHPSLSTDQHLFVMETARFAARLRLMEKYPKETRIMVPKFTEALLKALSGSVL
jgi:hypothetical protein